MTNEEAIEDLAYSQCYSCMVDNCDDCTIGLAIKALEKQIAKASEKTAVKTWWGIPYNAWCCQSCGTPVKSFEECYCSKCGQKLRDE